MVPEGLPRTLLLPVETTNREFDGKLLLAVKAIERGYTAVIGSHTALDAMLPAFPRAIYLSKAARSGSERVFDLLEGLGHVIVALDEEALVRLPDEAFHLRLDPTTFNRPRLLYAWGKSNAEVWRSYKAYGGAPIVEAGNPRIDMLRPEIREFNRDECEALRHEFGRFILLSSNFALVNHFIPGHVRNLVGKTADETKAAPVKTGFMDHKRKLFAQFLAFVPDLAAAISPNRLVIRPHPSENKTAWEQAAGGAPNVTVIHRSSMAPWLMAAQALVHNGCTSAIEASVLGTPALAYRPQRSAFDLELPNSLSVACGSVAALVAECRNRLAGDKPRAGGPTPEQSAIAEQHIASLTGRLAVDRILDSFAEFGAVLAARQPSAPSKTGVLSRFYARRAYRMVMTRFGQHGESDAYKSHKFPAMDVATVRHRVAAFQRILGRTSPIAVERIGANVFRLRGV